jgi:hypothetical protein
MFLKSCFFAIKKWGLFFIVILLMTGIEGCYFLDDQSILKRAAGVAWIGLGVIVFIFAAVYAVTPFFKPAFWKKPGKGWYLIAFFLPLFLIYVGVNGVFWTPVNLEGIQQTDIGIRLLHHDPDLGIYKIGYGQRYVAREYVLASLPTHFFGPSLIALRIGNSFVYVISYLAFLAALARYLESCQKNALFWTGWAGMMIALGQFTLIQARMFEQTTMPIGATLMFMTAVICFLLQPTAWRAAWIAWAMSFLTAGYTPAYGCWVFAVGVLFYLAFHPGHKHRILLLAVAQGVVSLLVAGLILHGQGQLQDNILKVGPGIFTWGDWFWRYFCGFVAVFNAGYSVIPAPLGITAFIVFYFGLKQGDWRVLLIFLWCFSIIVISFTLIGSFFNLPIYDAHRCIILIPVLAVGIVIFHITYYADSPMNSVIERMACISMIYMIYTSCSFPFLNRWYYLYDTIDDMDEVALHISEVTNSRGMPPIRKLYVVHPLVIPSDNLEFVLHYFAPDAVVSDDPIPDDSPGCYVLKYNDRLREYDTKIPSLNPRPYIALEPAPNAQAAANLLQKIKANNGLIVDYEFTEGSGTTTSDRNGNFSGATLSGGVRWAKEGPGLDFNGNKGFVTLPSMNIEPDEMSIAVWFKWNGGENWQRIFDFGDADNAYFFLSPVRFANGLRLSVKTLLPNPDEKFVDGPQLPVGVWTHLAVTFAPDKVILYENGEPVKEMKITVKPISVLRFSRNWIGQSRFADDAYLNGTMRSFQIYNRTLDSTEIRKMAGTPVAGGNSPPGSK